MDPIDFDRRFRRDPELWRGLVLDLCRKLGLPTDHFEPFLLGSNLIAAVGNSHVVKIFPSWLRHQWESETLVLRHLHGRLSLSTPECLGSGQLESGWTWLIMNKLAGETLEEHWPRLSEANKQLVMRSIGQLMAEVRALPIYGLESLEPQWETFLAKQLQTYRERHRRLGMPAWFIAELEAFVQKNLPLIPSEFQPILLTGEYTPFNLLGQWQGNDFELSSVIDFGDSMLGFAAYDLVGPSLFLGAGDPQLINALFDGYGARPDARLLLLLQILHRYSDFHSQMRITGWEQKAGNMDELARIIWP